MWFSGNYNKNKKIALIRVLTNFGIIIDVKVILAYKHLPT